MRGCRAFVGVLALVGGCASIGGEQFAHVAPPSSLSPVPHDAAALDPFTTYRGPGTDGQVGSAWRKQFLQARLNRAFAVSAPFFGYSGGSSTADAAIASAVRICEQARAGRGDACAPYAVNTEIVYPGAAYTLPFRGRALGPFTPSPEYIYYGPAAATGVIVWSHGTGAACADNGARFAAPSVITIINQAGWDVVRFDRDPCADDLSAALRRMPEGVAAAKRAGYRKIVLAGQSRGAMQSFESLRNPAVAADISAVIGFSPAMSGSDAYASTIGPRRWAAIASVLQGTMPAAAFFFDNDAFNPFARQQVETTSDTWRTALPNGHAYFNDDPRMTSSGGGHGAATSGAFTAKYAGCLLTLIDTGAASGPCAE